MTSTFPRSNTSTRRTGQIPRLLRRAAISAGVTYAGATVAYALVRPLLGEREGWIEFVDDLEPWAYLPAPVVGLLGGALGSGALGAAGAAMLAAFGLRWGHRFVRRSPDPSTASADFKVMTFNTLAWQREGHDLAASIAKANPDIVALQEIGPTGAHYLATTLADRLPYHYETRAATSSGAAVLSRYPLRDPVAFRALERGHWWQRMIVEAPFGPVTLFNVHTRIPLVRKTRWRFGGARIPVDFRTERRSREVRRLVEMLDLVNGPVIVAGDFNMTERSQDYKRVAARLRDSYKAVGAGLGHTFPNWGSLPRAFPAPWPTLRLDYIWHSEHFAPSWAYPGDAGRSDHRPVVAGLRWAKQPAEMAGSIPLAASTV